VAELQLKAGARGVSISKVSEAAVYVNAGITDIIIVHPFYGDHKFGALKELLPRAQIRCVVDSLTGAQGLAQVGQAAGESVPVLLKIDTGINRFGVPPGEPALRMARELTQIPGIEPVGILNHESAFLETSAEGVTRLAFECAAALSATARLLRNEGIQIRDVATGASTTARALCHYASLFPEITEIHPGAYVFGDWMYINGFVMPQESCAASVLVTVVSAPDPNRICVDGGQKTFSADPLAFMAARSNHCGPWRPTYGTVKGHPHIKITRLTEEIGVLTFDDAGAAFNIGDRIEIVPNHISLAINLHDTLYGVRSGTLEQEIPVLCRGMNY
jgi:D-serine deaminase-like pyridoxal phosphate-dependent protein